MKSWGKCRVTVSCTLYSHFGRTDIPSRNLWVVGVAMSHRLSEKALGHRFIDDPELFECMSVSVKCGLEGLSG